MSRKQNTPSRKPDARSRRQYVLAESEVVPVDACEKLKNELEHDGAKNLKVYPGAWQIRGSHRSRIDRKEGGKLLSSHATPSDLLAWLEARGARTGPLVIEAELPSPAQSKTQEPKDWREELASVRKRWDDVGLAVKFGNAWNAVKLLAQANDPLDQEKRIENLWRMHPEAAEKLGLPKLLQTEPEAAKPGPKPQADVEDRLPIIARYFSLPPAELCKKLDFDRIALPRGWEKRFESWTAAWGDAKYRQRIMVRIAQGKRRLSERR